MAHPKAQRCPCCGYAAVIPSARPGRVVRYRNAALTLPADLRLPACRRCKYEPLGLDTLPPELLESLYRDQSAKARGRRDCAPAGLSLPAPDRAPFRTCPKATYRG